MISVKDPDHHIIAVDRLTLELGRFGLRSDRTERAGKTTTIKALATLEPTTAKSNSGRLRLERTGGARKILGYMPDFPPVYDDSGR